MLKKILNSTKRNWLIMIIGCMTILCFYFDICLATISGKADTSYVYIIFSLVTAGLYVLCLYLGFSGEESGCGIQRQLAGINSIFCVVGLIITAGMFLELREAGINPFLFSVLIWTIVLLLIEIWICKKKIIRFENVGNFFIKIKMNIWQYRYMLILLVLLIVLAIDTQGIQFKWDGALYYKSCQNLSLFSLSNLAVYGHIAQTFSALIKIGTYVFGNVENSMMVCNILLLTVSSCFFYALLKFLVPDKSEFLYTIGTSVYAFAPFLLGMVNYYSLDYYCMCFFVLVLYFACRKQWIYYVIASLMFCFTKEPAIMVYGAMCVGIVCIDFHKDKSKRMINKIMNLFLQKKYYMMVVPGILWLATYILLGPWSAGEGGTAIDFSYIIEKCKVLYLLNFNWIFTLIIIVGIVYMLYKKTLFDTENEWMIPLFLGQTAFTIFSCLFKTVNHPRYSDISPVFLYLMGTVLILKLWKIMQPLCMSLLAILMLLSSYRTIDPVSKAIFKTVNIGMTNMLVVQEYEPGDGMIYNKQLLALEEAMSIALQDSVNRQDIILFPAINENTYYFDGMAEVTEVPEDEYVKSIELWNHNMGRRELLESSDTVLFEVYHVNNEQGVAKIMEEHKDSAARFSYFYLPFAGQELVDSMKKEYNVIEEKEFEYDGWIVGRIIFE